MSGYHLEEIPKGTYGEFDKVIEECLEFKDAIERGCKIMALVELSDILGAIEGYIEKNHKGITMSDLFTMSNLTRNAFESGERH